MTDFCLWLNSILPPLSNVWWDLVLALGILAPTYPGLFMLWEDSRKK